MNTNEEELDLLNIQVIITWIILGALVLSLILAENVRLKIEGKTPFWTDEEVKKISVTARWIIFIVAIVAIFINYRVMEIEKSKGANLKDIDAANLEFWAAILASVAAFLVLVAVGEATGSNEAVDIENPEL